MEATHFLGKLWFQLDAPNQKRAEAAFDQISDLAQTKLPKLLEEIFDRLDLLPHTTLKIDRLVLDLGTLGKENLEAELMQKIAESLKNALQTHFESKPDTPTEPSPQFRILSLLEYYFQHGRLPWWATKAEIESSTLESLWLELLHKNRAQAEMLMQRIFGEASPRQRFIRQVSPSTLERSLQLLPESLRHPLETPPKQSDLPLPPKPSREPSETAIDLPQQPNKAPLEAEAKAILYYLEWSRWPAGSSFVGTQIEVALLQFLQHKPQQARAALFQLAKSINLASRLLQQCSLKTHQEVLKVLYPQLWEELSLFLRDLLRLPAVAELNVDLATFIWRETLNRLLNPPQLSINLPALAAFLLEKLTTMGARLPSRILSLDELSTPTKPALDARTQEVLLLTLGHLKKSAKTEIQQTAKQWEMVRFEETEQAVLATQLLDKLLYTLQHGQAAWWDNTGYGLEQYFVELAKLPSIILSPLLEQLLSVPNRHKWLSALSDNTFTRLLQAFWGAYAGLIDLYLEAFAAAGKHLGIQTLPTVQLRLVFLKRALQEPSIDSALLMEWTLLELEQHSGQDRKHWIRALLEWVGPSAQLGDIRLHRLREVLQDLEEAPLAIVPLAAEPRVEEMPVKKQALSYTQLVNQELQVIWRFFEYGTISTDQQIPNASALEQVLQRLGQKHPDLLEPIIRAALLRERNLERVLHFFSPASWQLLGRLLWQNKYDPALQLWFALLLRLGKSDQTQMNRYFYTYLLQSGSSTPSGQFDALNFADGLLRFIAESDQIPLQSLWQLIQTQAPGTASSIALDALMPSLGDRVNQAVLAQLHKQRVAESSANSVEASLLVHNAGLVILAPYLQRYFSTLGLVKDQAFVDDAAAERGVHLLQYLATQQSETPEHLLVFNRVLCGLPIDTPLALGIVLEDAEKELSQVLLNSVLQNWNMMKNSTIDNLQGAFIIRDGLLRETEDKWKLHVEKKAFDVVMGDLPWTISVIKLPWMAKRIEVEWKINF